MDDDLPPPLALQLAVRVEKHALPTVAAACEAAVLATIELLDDARSQPQGPWHEPVSAWNGARIRKLVRRGRGAAWDRASEVDGVTVERAGAEARAFVPGPVDAVPKPVAKLQIQSTPLGDVERVSALPAVSTGAMVLAITPHFEMSWGKQAAQFAHAGQRLFTTNSDGARQRWNAAGRPIAIVHPTEELWDRLVPLAETVIHDGGLTEIPPGTNTTIGLWAKGVPVETGSVPVVSERELLPSEVARYDEVVRFGQDWSEPLARTIAAAFADDPVWGWMHDGPSDEPLGAERAIGLSQWFVEAMVAPCEMLGFRHHQAVGLWEPPGYVPSGSLLDEKAARFGELVLPQIQGDPMRGQALGEALRAARPEEPHWYLSIIAVDPARQGQGLGGRLLEPMHARCDRLGLPIYLESSNRANHSFYLRNGYRETGEIVVADCPPLMGFWRPPKGGPWS